MLSRKFGNSGISVPVIGQGSWQFPTGQAAIEEAKRALCLGIEQGMVHIDTAEMYGDSELIIGQAIKDLPRQELFIVSKVLPSNASYKGTIAACEKSLKRLNIDYLDCYLLHWRGNQPLSQTMSALEQLVDAGKIRSLGVSNFDVYDLEEAKAELKKHKIVCNQVLYNIYTRGIERQLIPYCQKHDIAIVGYTPFGQKSAPNDATRSGATLEAVARAHDVTVHQVMLAFLVRAQNLFTIPKAARAEHTMQNAQAGDLLLTQEEISMIESAYPAPAKDVPLAMI